ncbi:hypothetical protein D0T11_12510 [Hymenobacter rubripertinctus]|uniref:VPDSG-CTERM sorting domain-containing protein n=1 Tax=Hymenobacter rubripertinctus TaxID=2029981 RepID=A0A418QWF5_9BACT|nr:hypothetical protein D0T11_12510 [Hymenobacter rubripertinctus]
MGAAVVGLLLTSIQPAAAQGPGSGGPVPDPTDPTAVPIDGGASLLLAAGAAYGLKKLRQRRTVRQS